jgi:peptide/nickel transport system substrate-binding protein
MLRKTLLVTLSLLLVGLATLGCGAQPPEEVEKVVTQIVRETVIVEGTPEVVEKAVTQVVKETVMVASSPEVVEKEVTVVVAAEPTKYGGTLTVAMGAQPSTLNPYGGISGVSGKMLKQSVETLVELNKKTLEPQPLLATSWEVPDEQTYKFTLREGVKFHDGTDFDAEAVKFVFEYILDEENASPAASYFDRVESVEVVDEYEVVFHLSEPFGVFLANLAQRGYIMSPTAIQGMTLEEMDVSPVGTGPFKIVQWIRDDRVVFERYDDYWQEGLPYLDELVYKVLPDDTVKMIALRTGEVDLTDNVPATEVATIQRDEKLAFASIPSTGYRSIYLNNAAPPFDDVRLRQALAWAVDRDELIRLGSLGVGTPAYGSIAPPQWAYDPTFKPFKRDLEKVQELLTEAGVPDGFSFTIKVANSPDEIRMVEVLQQQAAEAGIDVELIIGEYTALRSTVIEGDYDAFYVGWLGGPDPDTNTWNSFHSDGWFNWVNYSNPEVDRLLDEARSISDIEERTLLYRQAEELISSEAAMVFLKFPYYAADGQAYSLRVKDFVPDAMQIMYFDEVWVDPK